MSTKNFLPLEPNPTEDDKKLHPQETFYFKTMRSKLIRRNRRRTKNWVNNFLVCVLPAFLIYLWILIHYKFSNQSSIEWEITFVEDLLNSVSVIDAPIIHFKQEKSNNGASYTEASAYCAENSNESFEIFQDKLFRRLGRTFETCDRMENVAWVTVTNLHNYCATHMVQMMREWKANFFTFKYKQSNNSKGSSMQTPPGVYKLEAIVHNFYQIVNYDYVIYIDTADVIFSKCPSEAIKKIVQKMEREKIDMLFQAEPYSWPDWAVSDPELNQKWYNCTLRSKTQSDPVDCYLCSGVWVANTQNLLFYLMDAISNVQYELDLPTPKWRSFEGNVNRQSDQGLLSRLHEKWYPAIQLDTHSMLSKRFFRGHKNRLWQFGKGVDQCYFVPPKRVRGCKFCSARHDCEVG